MGLSSSQRQRLREMVAEAQQIMGGCLHEDGRPKTFAELEEECIELGDLFTAGLLGGRVAERDAEGPSSCCPECQRLGERQPDEPRLLQTDRGEVAWSEPSYYCSRCRRSFFPSVG